MLRRIGHARKKVMALSRLLITKADVLKAVMKRCAERALAPDSETALYLGDIQDHVITMVQNLNHYEQTLARSHSNYLAQISIEITQASNRTSDVAMRMTALASLLLPLNLITGNLTKNCIISLNVVHLFYYFIKGLWGMNVRVPGQDGDTLFEFFLLLSFMALLTIITFIVVRRYEIV